MNKLDNSKRSQVVAALVEGNSIRATIRMTGVAKNTVAKLLVELGSACARYQDEAFRNLNLKRIQCDEIWAFIGCKEKNVTSQRRINVGWCGDAWTWVAIDADTKLVPCWVVGGRNAETARYFIDDLRSRLANRVQLTTDGYKMYLNAVWNAFEGDVDYAMLVKLYGDSPEGQKRYSPAAMAGIKREVIAGHPDPLFISTSYVERQNLTMRMSMRRFTRLTNGFSKKLENHVASVALHFMHYNFCRIHQTLRITPAMAAGVSDHVWSITELVGLIG